MEKHTKEYAKKLAIDHIGGEVTDSLDHNYVIGFRDGYLKAIEENAVPELFIACVHAKQTLEAVGCTEESEIIQVPGLAIQKATT